MPVHLSTDSGTISIRWIDFGTSQPREPFFKQTLASLRSNDPVAAERTTDFSFLLEAASKSPIKQPAGVIFHISRCGSTLLTNVLRTSANVVALSEPDFLDYLLDPGGPVASMLPQADTFRARSLILNAIVSMYGSTMFNASDCRLVIKCFHTTVTHLRTARLLWPDVPFIIMIRDPLQVAVSNLTRPAYWLRSRHNRLRGSRVLGITADQVAIMSPEEYCSRVIGCLCEAATQQMDNRCAVVDYSDMNPELYYKIAGFFDISLPPAKSIEMMSALLNYSKDISGSRRYEDDSSKVRSANEATRHFVKTFAHDKYIALRDAENAYRL